MLKIDYDKNREITRTSASAEEILEWAVSFLLDNLYVPSSSGKIPDRRKLEKYSLEGDAINWGDLGVVEVTKSGDRFIVLVEEASPEAANLQRYVGDWLTEWGWNVEVVTAW